MSEVFGRYFAMKSFRVSDAFCQHGVNKSFYYTQVKIKEYGFVINLLVVGPVFEISHSDLTGRKTAPNTIVDGKCVSVSALGAAYGTAKSGTGIAAMSVMRPELIMKSIIPVVMAGIVAIYGLVVAVLIASGLGEPSEYSLYR